MTDFRITAWNKRGASLIETVIAMGVLAVAIPLVFGALAESGKSTQSSEAETRSTWIIPACMEEIHASRSGRSQFFPTTLANEPFPALGDVWALAFSGEGKPVGKIPKADYDKGTRDIHRAQGHDVADGLAIDFPGALVVVCFWDFPDGFSLSGECQGPDVT